MPLPIPLRRSSLALLAALSCAGLPAHAAEIYVLDARIEREGVSSASPTFIVTPGERALLAFHGERGLEVAMTLVPREGVTPSGDAFDLKVEVIEGVQLDAVTVPVSLAETETLELAGRTIDVLVRVQQPIGEPTTPPETDDAPRDGSAPASAADGG